LALVIHVRILPRIRLSIPAKVARKAERPLFCIDRLKELTKRQLDGPAGLRPRYRIEIIGLQAPPTGTERPGSTVRENE
jgi:hypothetical protein